MTGKNAGRFIVLDGVDGCGKSTQARLLVEGLSGTGTGTGTGVRHLREPGSTRLGEGLREILLGRGLDFDAGVEALLFAAARRQMLAELVGPALDSGAHVVCERFHASTFAYQAHAGDQDPEALLGLLSTWANHPRPHLTVVLDIDVEEALLRRGPASDRIEDKGREYQMRVREGYLRFAELNDDVCVVDAAGATDDVAARVWREVEHVL